MSRRTARPLRLRQRTMRFALWARTLRQPPTTPQIAEFLGVHLQAARQWRHDWLEAIDPTNPLPGVNHAPRH